MSWFRRFMMGRYGMDQLSNALFVLLILLSILSRAMRYQSITNVLYGAVAFFIFYRIFSRNIPKRYQENMRFLRVWNPLKSRWKNTLKRLKDMRYYRYYRCSHCKQMLRVPKGKGKISITCPKCKLTMIKKS